MVLYALSKGASLGVWRNEQFLNKYPGWCKEGSKVGFVISVDVI